MLPADSRSNQLSRAPWGKHARWFLVPRSGAYLFVILAVVMGTGAYGFWKSSVFGCQTSGYSADQYLAYCGTTGYGDYDYGAFWFDLEPTAIVAASRAQVLFLGNSRMQFALSTEATDEWFTSFPVSYYLLGFAYDGNYKFEAPLLRRIRPTPRAYVINLDLFFEESDPPPARIVMRDSGARTRYARKRRWQDGHRLVCQRLPVVCGDEVAFFRSRTTGAWVVSGGQFQSAPVSYDESVDRSVVEAYVTSGSRFLSDLAVGRGCHILTMVPSVNTPIGTAKAIAQALGRKLVAPELAGLITFDGSHLDQDSAERWSTAFMAAAGPQIRKCLTTA
jgi:hypothetical protein